MKKLLIATVMSAITVISFAQGNMIQNGSFETVSKKIKSGGMIDYAVGWSSPTDNKADVFSSKAKSDEYKTPANLYGDTDPLDGTNYAGIIMYSYKDDSPRQYLQAELTEKMKEDKVYCVKMNVMLSMLSKYSSNNIGIYISKKPLTPEDIEAYNIEPQIIHSQNRIFDEQFDWEPICQTYIADGGEEYITIGNFAHY